MLNIKFNSVTIHHFMSYDHAEIDLRDKGYCLVRGVNNNPLDSSKSNGAGKSTTFNAISYALVGETLQGLKSNLSNIYFNDGCYVKLDFEVDDHKYSILRSKDDKKYKTNLKIFIDGEDKSGPGIKDSQKLLEQYLPDITSELLGSVILLGQGMPMKFTANTPSGRKEVLEHLSQSDFMIQDLKNRIAERSEKLAVERRKSEDEILTLTTSSNIYHTQLDKNTEEYNQRFTNKPDFDTDIKNFETTKSELDVSLSQCNEKLTTVNTSRETTNSEFLNISNEKRQYLDKYEKEHKEIVEEINKDKVNLLTKYNTLKAEINKLKDIKEICPTCGQRILGVIKPDTSKQEAELLKIQKDIESLTKEAQEDAEEYSSIIQKINNKYDSKISELQNKISEINSTSNSIQQKINTLNAEILNVVNKLNKAKKDKEVYNQEKESLEKNIKDLQEKLEDISKQLTVAQTKKELIESHLETINKMNTIIKRDFRGLLLKSVIDYIEKKSKEYASKIFNTDDMRFTLDGNDINIAFCGKDYENLSGGEKQRVDLLIQFAIKDFMCNYLQFSSNILVLDEITDALDAESCDKVINFITDELRDVESVFIISHHDNTLEIPVDSEIVVEKNSLGVSNVIYQG